MKILPEMTMKALSEAVAGELVALGNWGKRALAIVLRKTDDGHAILGFLEPPEANDPQFCHLKMDADIGCLSFGSDWLLELDVDEVLPPDYRLDARQPGLLHLAADKLTLTFQAHRSGSVNGDATFDFKKKALSTRTSDAAGFPVWSIWASEEMRRLPGAKPVFSFPPPPGE